MTVDAQPLVSVVVLNHNGAHLLDDVLSALRRQSYANREVLVVDNASTDGSVELVRTRYPDVEVLPLESNLGYTGGNNHALRRARGEFVALVNNDTIPEREWLQQLVSEARSMPDIGAVAPKMIFYRPFLPVRLTVESFRPDLLGASSDPRELGVLLDEESAFEGCAYRKPIFKEGFHQREWHGERVVRWTAGDATLYLPVESPDEPATLRLVIAGGDLVAGRSLAVGVDTTPIAEVALEAGFTEHRLPVPAELVRREAFEVINNAGSFLDERGNSGDRGIFEPDRGQFDQPEDITAICGGSVLFRRSALDRAGLFDRHFFAYYEDTELSWRLRSCGYRLRYQPASVIRHHHAATNVEWSPMFTFHVARNRLLMLAKHGSLRSLLAGYRAERGVLRDLHRRHAQQRDPQVGEQLAVRRRVLRSFRALLPKMLLKRWRLLAD